MPTSLNVWAAHAHNANTDPGEEVSAIEEIEEDLVKIQDELTETPDNPGTASMRKTGMGKGMSQNKKPKGHNKKSIKSTQPMTMGNMGQQSTSNPTSQDQTGKMSTPATSPASQPSGGMKNMRHGMSGMSMKGQTPTTTEAPLAHGKAKQESMNETPMSRQKMMSTKRPMKMCCARMGSMMGKPKSMPMESAARTAAPTIDVGHVLHLGERNFFLDLQEELRVTEQQQKTLNDHQRQWLSIRDSQETAIGQAENHLWELTQKLPPNQDELSNTIGNITQLYAAQRQAFIEAVSKAAQELTPEQIAIARSLPLEGDS